MTEHSAAAPVLRFVDDRAVRDLEQLATRARRVADTGMRLHVVPEAGRSRTPMLAQWVSVLQPAGLGDGVPVVLGLRTVPLATADGVADLDAVVALGSVTERTARMRGQDPVDLAFAVPPGREHVTWTALTPPRGGWTPVAEVADEELAEVATRGADAVRDALPENPGRRWSARSGRRCGDPCSGATLCSSRPAWPSARTRWASCGPAAAPGSARRGHGRAWTPPAASYWAAPPWRCEPAPHVGARTAGRSGRVLQGVGGPLQVVPEFGLVQR